MEHDPKTSQNIDSIPFADLGLSRRKLRTLVGRHISDVDEAALDQLSMDELWARLPSRVQGVLLRVPQPRAWSRRREIQKKQASPEADSDPSV